MWVCNENNGAICYKNGELSAQSKKIYLKDFNVSSVLQDNNGNYWFTTTNNGVFYLISKNIYYYTKKDGLIRNNIKCIEVENDNVWLAYNFNTISKFYNNKFKHIKLSKKENLKINKLIYDKQQKQLLIGSSNYLFVLNNDKTEQRPQKVFLPINEFNRKININDIVINDKGNYILACEKGIELYKNIKLNKYHNDLSLFSVNTNSILYENDSTIWFGTVDGLWKYKNGIFKNYGEINEKFKIRVLDIIKYKNKLIIATKGGGILIYENNKITQLTKKNGLSSNTITTLLITDNNRLWLGSINGLNNIILLNNNKYIINTKNFHKLIPSRINDIKKIKNKLLIATNKGLIYFDYNKHKKKQIKVPLYLNSIKINEKDTILKSNYILKNNQNNIQIDFEAITFKNSNNIKFRYKIIGLDTNWVITNNSIRLSQLQSGKYKIIIEVFNKNNTIKSEPIIIDLTLKKSFLQTNFMIFIYILLALIIIFGIYKSKISRMKKQIILEQNLNWHKKQALFSQMNPHFLFNSLNSINNYILHNEKKLASKYLNKFSILIRRTLENSQNEYITLENEIETNKLYLEIESLRLKDRFNYKFIVDNNINIYKYKIPGMIIQPFLENSIWHGIQPLEEKGEVKVIITRKNNSLLISIKDNGIGRQKSIALKSKLENTHKSLGTSIAYKRIELLKKIFKEDTSIEYLDKYENEGSIGTSVHITIPIIK